VAKVIRIAKPGAVLTQEILAAMERKKPFVVNMLGASCRAANFGSAWEAEAFAVEQLGSDRALFGAVVRYGSAVVSRVV
jgi:hypothetical protein